MIVDGKALAEKIKQELAQVTKAAPRPYRLAILLVGDDAMSTKYTNLKKKIGEGLGIEVEVKNLNKESSTDDIVAVVKNINNDQKVDGLIVQLPLPEQVDRDQVFEAIEPQKDVDALSENTTVLSPVVRSIKYILEQNGITDFSKFKVVVVGYGYLVGQPVEKWLKGKVESLDILTTETSDEDSRQVLGQADLIISGAGVPNLVKPADIKEGVILIDASTSDVNGKTVGDIDPACANKAALYTPVPGGVGPLTVVMLFANLLELMKK